MIDNNIPPGEADQSDEQVIDVAGRAAMVGVFGLIIVAYGCAAAAVLGVLVFVAWRIVAP